jgi:hypothetical protein
MADTSPQGRLTVAKALRELTAFGYYRVERVRQPDGTFISQAHVYDVPHTAYATAQVVPGAVLPGSGGSAADDRGAHPVKNRGKEPTLPAPRTPADAVPGTGTGGRREIPSPPTSAALGEAASLLHRVTAAEPRLRLGAAEAITLAPLVAPWLERGLGPRDLSAALLGGLPDRVHSASAFLRDRLTRKLPPAPEPVPAAPRRYECAGCARPTTHVGICRTCAGLDATSQSTLAERAHTAARGRALTRAALNSQPWPLVGARA